MNPIQQRQAAQAGDVCKPLPLTYFSLHPPLFLVLSLLYFFVFDDIIIPTS